LLLHPCLLSDILFYMMSNRQGDVNPTVSNADSNDQQMETRTSTVSLTSAANTVVNVEQRHTMVPTDEFNKLMKYIDNLNLNNGPYNRKRPRDPQDNQGSSNKRGKPNISEANLNEYHLARNLRSKQAKYEASSSALDKYLSHDDTIVPKGLEINVNPMIGTENNSFMERWTNRVHETQRGLLTLQAEYCKGATHEYTTLANNAIEEMKTKMADNPEELRDAQSAISTVATRVKATEYTKLQGRWSRDIGIHESRKSGIVLPKKRQENSSRPYNANNRPRDWRQNNSNRPTMVAKRRLPQNNGPRVQRNGQRVQENGQWGQNNDPRHLNNDVSPTELRRALEIVRALR